MNTDLVILILFTVLYFFCGFCITHLTFNLIENWIYKNWLSSGRKKYDKAAKALKMDTLEVGKLHIFPMYDKRQPFWYKLLEILSTLLWPIVAIPLFTILVVYLFLYEKMIKKFIMWLFNIKEK